MQNSDLTRHRKQNIRRRGTDAMIGRGIKKAARTLANAPSNVGKAANRATGRVASRIIESKWWNS
jgi:hypothetical protein